MRKKRAFDRQGPYVQGFWNRFCFSAPTIVSVLSVSCFFPLLDLAALATTLFSPRCIQVNAHCIVATRAPKHSLLYLTKDSVKNNVLF